jgi:NhaP-type Na+/H+ or K+/H+ antiporter
MSETLLVGLSAIIAIGVSAQWLAWRTKLPAILVLLIFGILAGPVTGFIDPDQIFGDLLSPFVSISVAIILFEGGLSLRFSELREIGTVVVNLITIGILLTWALASLSAYYLLDLGLELSVLFGAILIVTGPTVIIPLLRQVRPTESVGSVLRWEGIVNDPIGAMMAVLVFEIILSGK